MALVKLNAGDFGEDGFSRARLDGRELVLDAAVPGEEVLASVKGSRAKVVEVLKPSDYRADPGCKLFPVCPGCRWRHMGRKGQALFRAKVLEKTFGREPDQVWQGPGDDWRYRAIFQVKKAGDMVYLGFEQSRGMIYDLWACPNLPESHSALLERIKRFFKDQDVSFYSRLSNRGKLKAMGFFGGSEPENLVVALIAKRDIRSRLLAQKIADLSPAVSGVAEINGDRVVGLFGEHHFFQKIGNFTYRMTPGALWPENPFAHRKLAELVQQRVPAHSTVIEMGAGYLLSVHISKPARVLVADSNPQAVSELRSCVQANPEIQAEVILDNLADLSQERTDTEVFIVNSDRSNLRGFEPGNAFKILIIGSRPDQMAANHRYLTGAGFALEKLVAVEHKPHQHSTLMVGEYVR